MNAAGIYFSCGILLPPADLQRKCFTFIMVPAFLLDRYFSITVFLFQRIENLLYVRFCLSSTVICQCLWLLTEKSDE